jgi:DNA-binding MarR family transcriptional regulator
MAQKGKKSLRGIPEKYDEIKRSFSYSLTPTAKRLLKEKACELGISTSELLERIARDDCLILKNQPHQECK